MGKRLTNIFEKFSIDFLAFKKMLMKITTKAKSDEKMHTQIIFPAEPPDHVRAHPGASRVHPVLRAVQLPGYYKIMQSVKFQVIANQ